MLFVENLISYITLNINAAFKYGNINKFTKLLISNILINNILLVLNK